ncbi:G-protein coupled receptor [Fasciolopsis buskii]|uniref:G-protein coupled receptor n=1 Tax=Fasciolopsis buskii TaxID=27845 RepID=A0A8E0VGX1_9TREM|nr:G-protein coupled receptor [Fasciolopsis buski]
MQSPRSICALVSSDQINNWLTNFNSSEIHFSSKYTNSASLLDIEAISSQLETHENGSPQLCQFIRIIIYYVPPILFLIGSFGNILSFSVLSRRSVLYPSSYVYLAVLALADECVLLVGLLRQWIDRLAGRRLEDQHWVLCKVLNFTGVTASCFSVWIIVAVTVERALVIILPLHSTQAERMKRSKIIILCLFITMICITCHFFVTVDIVTEMFTFHSTPTNLSTTNITDDNLFDLRLNVDYDSFIDSSESIQVCEFRSPFKENGFRRVWIWIDATLYSYLPFFLITVFNMIILINLHEASRRRFTLVSNWAENADESQRTHPVFNRLWRSLSTFCRCPQRVNECTRTRVCQFCAQSFPIDRFHGPPGLLANTNRAGVSATFTNSHVLLHTLSQPTSRHIWPARAYGPTVNIRFGACRMNGYEIKTMNVERRARPTITSEVRQLTVLLLLLSGTFLITTAPVVIVKLVIGWNTSQSSYRLIQLELLDCVAEMLMYTNHAANFYLYLVAGTRFRREIRKLLRMRRCPRRGDRKRRRPF